MNPLVLLQLILNGLTIGAVYALFALGYTLVFSILRVINFSHGAIFTLGAYFTFALTGTPFGFNGLLAHWSLPFGLPYPVALIGGGLLAGLCGIVVERIAFRPLRTRGADPLLSLISSLGVGTAIVNVIQYLVGAENYNYPSNPFGKIPSAINFGSATQPVPVRTVPLIILGVSLLIMVLLTLFITRTRTGKALQAISEDTLTASLLGINPDRLIWLTFFLSGLIGGISGALIGVNSSIAGPYFGVSFGLKGLAVIVLGGLGNVPGAVLGGFVLGLIEAFVPSAQIGYKDAFAFALLFVILLIRPQGLLGRTSVQKV
jgi:branched-chain amino acid transport system permease protein